jgi:hypothetical protein
MAMVLGGRRQWEQLTARHWRQQLDASGFSVAPSLRRVASVADRVADAWGRTVTGAEAEGFALPLLSRVRAAFDARAPALRELVAFIPRGRRPRH